jgi:glutamine cyclotransferase
MPMGCDTRTRRTPQAAILGSATLLLVALVSPSRPGQARAEATPAASAPAPAPTPPRAAAPRPVERFRVEVVNVYPHDPEAFTQGLLLHDGVLYESTGLEGRSSLRAVELATGRVTRRLDLPPSYFGEVLALAGDRLIQLTWQNRVGFVYERATFKQLGQFSFETEGWGLCFDGRRLVLSDGSDRLSFRDPETFAPLGEQRVTLDGRPLRRLNELECVGDAIYANVWTTDTIVRIDPRSGAVTAVIDASGLLTPAERHRADILNGITVDPARGTFLITGKLWPKLFEVRFVPVGG